MTAPTNAEKARDLVNTAEKALRQGVRIDTVTVFATLAAAYAALAVAEQLAKFEAVAVGVEEQA